MFRRTHASPRCPLPPNHLAQDVRAKLQRQRDELASLLNAREVLHQRMAAYEPSPPEAAPPPPPPPPPRPATAPAGRGGSELNEAELRAVLLHRQRAQAAVEEQERKIAELTALQADLRGKLAELQSAEEEVVAQEEEEEEEEEDEAEAEAEEGGDESGLAERVLRLLAMKTDECQQLAAVVEEARAAGMDSSNPRLMLAERNLAMRYQEIKELAAFGAPTPPPRGGGLIQRPLGSARPTRCPLGRLLSAPCHTAPSTILPPCRSRRHPAAHKLGLDMGDDDDEEEEDEEDGGGGGTMTAVAAAQEEAAEAALEKVQRLQAELDACVQELRIVDEKANPKVN